MHNINNNIDLLIKDKLDNVDVDTSYMTQDFDAIANLLPTAPITGSGTTSAAVAKSPWWFSVNTWLVLVALTAASVATILLSKNKKVNNKNTFVKTENNKVENVQIVDSDTPVVVSEIPKDPKTAPKK